MLSLMFIRRPKTAAVISIALFLAGAICALRLPVAEYPTVAPPQIEVTAVYPGASADEVASTVAAPIEAEVNSVEDLIYFDSKSDNAGNYTPTVTFKPGANENMALVNVNNAVKLVEPKLPAEVKANGITFLLQAVNGQSSAELAQAAGQLAGRLAGSGKSLYAFPTFECSTPLVRFRLDRQVAEQMGVRVADVFAALQGQLGSYYVNDFNLDSKNYQVNIQADLKNRATVDQLASLHVTGKDGAQVPILSVGNFGWTVGPRQVERFNLFPSAFFQAQSAPGVSSGEFMREVEKQVAEMGPDWQVSYTDLAYQERQNEGQIVWMLLLSVVMAYLFLVGQYENWTVPIPVMLCVMVSLCGGLLGIKLSGIAMNIYCQLGVLMLIGITAKSAILIAEYAMQKEADGVPLVEAAIEGMKQRFRSVQMTGLSFVIGVLPLLFATGPGANARHAVGVATFWGMLTACVVGMLFVPPLYVFFRRLAGVKG